MSQGLRGSKEQEGTILDSSETRLTVLKSNSLKKLYKGKGSRVRHSGLGPPKGSEGKKLNGSLSLLLCEET